MPIVSYCKKCKQEVPLGETCALCGTKLNKNSSRVSWRIDHVPVKDWLCWNSILRILLPVFLTVAVLIIGVEWIIRGIVGVQVLLSQGLLWVLGGILAGMAFFVFIWLALQGQEMFYFVLDQKGIHIQTYLPKPTKIKLWLRLQSSDVLEAFNGEEALNEYGLFIGEKQLEWRDIKRVQLWPGQDKLLFYAPSWWLLVVLHCQPNTYEDALSYVWQHLSKMKQIKLPGGLAGLFSEDINQTKAP